MSIEQWVLRPCDLDLDSTVSVCIMDVICTGAATGTSSREKIKLIISVQTDLCNPSRWF